MGGHDPSAVIFEDGQLRYGAEEERFSRQKHANGEFPERAIEACLDACDVQLPAVDRVVIPWKVSRRRSRVDTTYALDSVKPGSPTVQRAAAAARDLYLGTDPDYSRQTIQRKLERIGSPVPPITMCDHHRSHAASAFYPSGFDEALVVSVDGQGEADSTVVWSGTEDGLERVRSFRWYNSLGRFFGAITEFLGFRAFNGEGKVMGLAPYGDRNPDIEAQLRSAITVGPDYDVSAISADGPEAGARELEELFDRPQKPRPVEFTQWEKDLAYTAQATLEEVVVELVESSADQLGVRQVCLAGGVALNCKMNKRVMESEAVDDLFVQPVAHDAGTPLGAGLLEFPDPPSGRQSTVYWGSSYSTEEITSMLENYKIEYSTPEDVTGTVAQALADGSLVGWFRGRFEMGPRALGNRSILADPRSVESRDRVNDHVKHRESWRPFAPSILERALEEYLVDGEPAPFMIKTFDVRPEKRSEIEAVLHPGDGTTRPQTVNREQNPRYHELISEFERITGVPVILNTSFNDHGEPIVDTPQQAVKDFFGTGLDLLVMEDVVVEKQSVRDELGRLTQQPERE